jgi:6,7-dimethyl-8-ribityllumazine synthase
MNNTTSAFIALSDIPTASHSTAGILETATNAEATNATANDKIITPANLSHIDLSTFDNDAGFISDITGESLNDLSDVSFTAGAGIDNYVLTFDNGTSSWGAEAAPTASPASETVAGVIEIATNAEATAGTATDKALVPSNISSLDLSAMDNTTSAFISDITGESLNDLSDVSFTAGAGIDNYVLTFDNGTSSWGAEAVPGASPASETTAGIIEIATNAEATAGTATDKALVPSNLSSVDLSVLDNTTSAFITAGDIPTASETVAGVIEIATNAEAGAGTATDKALVPSNISSLDLSAMDNTTSAFISDITGESLNDLSDVSFTAGAGIDNYVLTYDNGTSSWGAEAVPGGSPASETTAGIIEIATNAEATAGTATDKALVPSNLSSVDLSVLDNTTSAFITVGDIPTASETTAGKIEIATNAEAGAGTATDKALVPSNISSLDLSAMDNTTSAFISDITSESLNDLSDVSFTAGAGIDNYVLTYDNGTSSWGAEAAPTASPASETVAGVIEIATNAEATAGTATDKALVPSNLSSVDLSVLDNTTSAFITDVVNDTTPQLGGNLDVNGNDIVSVSNGNIEIAPDGTGSFIIKGNATSGSGRVVLNCEQNSHGIILKGPPHSAAASYTLTFPNTDGNADQVLKTDGSGNLDWVDPDSAPDVVTDSSGTNTTISTSTGIEEIHLISNGTNNVTITIPAASTVGEGYKYNIKRLGTGTVSVAPSSGTIDGSSSFSLATQYDSVTLVSDNSNYHII